jgi:demethylmenaquinone methyltransferase/2-methoxy-6-polyprenyl-1,4-benzoquinol methylase
MAVQVQARSVQSMFGRIARRYDFANNVLSGGIHLLWRHGLVRAVPPTAAVLDVATGTGGVLALLLRRCRLAVGVDFCLPMLEVGAARGLKSLVCGDGLRLPFADSTFDAITVAFGVRNFEDPLAGLRELHRVLKPGGTIHVLEFGQPRNAFFAKVYESYSRWILPRLGGLVTGDRAAYEYLPETSRLFPCDGAFCELLREAGFVNPESRALTGGIAYRYRAVVSDSVLR